MRIVRVISYEGTLEQLNHQMERSLKDGEHQPGAVKIEVRTTVVPPAAVRANGTPWWVPGELDEHRAVPSCTCKGRAGTNPLCAVHRDEDPA